MNRRHFLQFASAFGLAPMLPQTPAFASALQPHVILRAEMIVRAHNSCSTPMLQRLLKLDPATAVELKTHLFRTGFITSNANAYGIHQALSPLSKSAFLSPTSNTSKAIGKLRLSEKAESKHEVENFRKESENNKMGGFDESDFEQVESISEKNDNQSDCPVNAQNMSNNSTAAATED